MTASAVADDVSFENHAGIIVHRIGKAQIQMHISAEAVGVQGPVDGSDFPKPLHFFFLLMHSAPALSRTVWIPPKSMAMLQSKSMCSDVIFLLYNKSLSATKFLFSIKE